MGISIQGASDSTHGDSRFTSKASISNARHHKLQHTTGNVEYEPVPWHPRESGNDHEDKVETHVDRTDDHDVLVLEKRLHSSACRWELREDACQKRYEQHLQGTWTQQIVLELLGLRQNDSCRATGLSWP